ncbi:hypothetical protein AAG570_013872 [Ranatra chinensis]|uniref:Uncharacterized protein n=1 Tax=Ranatra chinensis TaxID=642074 RepID=A0ABD0YDF2_9HEMI
MFYESKKQGTTELEKDKGGFPGIGVSFKFGVKGFKFFMDFLAEPHSSIRTADIIPLKVMDVGSHARGVDTEYCGWAVYRPRGALARALYNKHISDQCLETFDRSQPARVERFVAFQAPSARKHRKFGTDEAVLSNNRSAEMIGAVVYLLKARGFVKVKHGVKGKKVAWGQQSGRCTVNADSQYLFANGAVPFRET